MNTQMFLKITNKIATIKFPEKEEMIITGIGLYPNEIEEYFKNTPIKRNRMIVDMKKVITQTILQSHNNRYTKFDRYYYTLKNIAKILNLDNHASIINLSKNKKNDDKLAVFVRENYIRLIKEKKHPIPFKREGFINTFILVEESEIPNLILTRSKRAKANYVYEQTRFKNFEYFSE